MTGPFIVAQLPLFPPEDLPPKKAENKPNLHTYWGGVSSPV
jgi:truncated hemoglobin YjbI